MGLRFLETRLGVGLGNDALGLPILHSWTTSLQEQVDQAADRIRNLEAEIDKEKAKVCLAFELVCTALSLAFRRARCTAWEAAAALCCGGKGVRGGGEVAAGGSGSLWRCQGGQREGRGASTRPCPHGPACHALSLLVSVSQVGKNTN